MTQIQQIIAGFISANKYNQSHQRATNFEMMIIEFVI